MIEGSGKNVITVDFASKPPRQPSGEATEGNVVPFSPRDVVEAIASSPSSADATKQIQSLREMLLASSGLRPESEKERGVPHPEEAHPPIHTDYYTLGVLDPVSGEELAKSANVFFEKKTEVKGDAVVTQEGFHEKSAQEIQDERWHELATLTDNLADKIEQLEEMIRDLSEPLHETIRELEFERIARNKPEWMSVLESAKYYVTYETDIESSVVDEVERTLLEVEDASHRLSQIAERRARTDTLNEK